MPRFNRKKEDRKDFTRSQKILIGFIVFFLLFGTVTRITQGNIFSNFAYDSLSMIRYALIEGPVKAVTNYSSDLANMYKVRDENDALRSQISSQDNYKSQLDESNRKVKELEALMKLTSTSGYDSLYADIVNRDVQGWSNTITISKGSSDGVAVDDAVVCSKGLIGKVSQVNRNTAKVKLLTTENDDNQVAVKVEISAAKTTEGILQNYNNSTQTYVIQIFDTDAKLKENMKVITSGQGGVFPSGILIGTVSKIGDLYNSTGKSVSVKPSVDFNDFEYVAVLKGTK